MSLEGTQIPGGFIPRFALLLALSYAAAAAPGDGSEWGNSGATPLPHGDSGSVLCGDVPRAGYWWWPTAPANNAVDTEVWGNRGVVYGAWTTPGIVVGDPPQISQRPEVPYCPEMPSFNPILFDKGKAVMRPEHKQVIEQLIPLLKQRPRDTVVLTGHTSDEGSEESNMGLGQRRADAVKRYMAEQGIDPERIAAMSKGEAEPVAPNDSEANRKLNRRVAFDITMIGP